jgi:ribosomal protein S11
MLKKYKRKQHFNFSIEGDKARLYLRKTFTNIFVTFTDMDNKVIICKTSGNSGIKDSKRRKKAPQALETIVKYLIKYLTLYKIKYVYLVFKMRLNRYTYTLIKELSFYGIQILGFKINRPIAFNGVRARKLRRR